MPPAHSSSQATSAHVAPEPADKVLEDCRALGIHMVACGYDRNKLKTLDDVYRFAVEQLAISRGHFLELVVVVILLFELMLFFLGIMT